METFVLLFLEKILEAIYFSLFLIIGKNIKNKRILFVCIMIFEYLMLKQFIHYNVLFQFIYIFLSFVNLKVLYKEKAQITDVFLFAVASIILIISSAICFIVIYFTIKSYILTLILNRVIIFLFLHYFKDSIRIKYKEFYSLWNRHNNPNKIKSLTLRNISIISFNIMFWLINIGMVLAKIMLGF